MVQYHVTVNTVYSTVVESNLGTEYSTVQYKLGLVWDVATVYRYCTYVRTVLYLQYCTLYSTMYWTLCTVCNIFAWPFRETLFYIQYKSPVILEDNRDYMYITISVVYSTMYIEKTMKRCDWQTGDWSFLQTAKGNRARAKEARDGNLIFH